MKRTFCSAAKFWKKTIIFFDCQGRRKCESYTYTRFSIVCLTVKIKGRQEQLSKKNRFFFSFTQLFIYSNCNYFLRNNNRMLANKYLMFIKFRFVLLFYFSICFVFYIFIVLFYIAGFCGQSYA